MDYQDICHPITKEFRESLCENILKSFAELERTGEKHYHFGEAQTKELAFNVAVTPYEREGSSLRGLARIYLEDCFVINQVTLVEGRNGIFAGYMGSIPLMMVFTALAALGQGPWQGDMNAVIASCSEYTYLTQGKRVDGTMYSCTSLGVKIGGGIGTAVVGWLLELSGYVGTHAVQPQSALNMMQFMYLWLPLIFDVLIMFILSRMNVEETNVKLKKEKGITVETAQ